MYQDWLAASSKAYSTKSDNCDRATALPSLEATEVGIGLSSDSHPPPTA